MYIIGIDSPIFFYKHLINHQIFAVPDSENFSDKPAPSVKYWSISSWFTVPGNAHVKGFVFIHIHVMETSEHHSNHMFRVNYPGWTKHAGIWSLSNPTEGNGLSKRWLVGFQSLYHLISCVQSSFILGSIIWFVQKKRRKTKILLWGSWVTSL